MMKYRRVYRDFIKSASLARHGVPFSGFTILELIVSVGIIAGIGAVITQTFFATTRSNTKVEVLKEVKQNGDFATTTMERMIRNARSITSSCSESGTTSTSITIENTDGAITTFGCLVDGSVTRIASTSAMRTDYLTSSAVTLSGTDCTTSSLSFTCMSIASVPRSIKFQFNLSQKGSSPDQFERASTTFQAAVSLRN